VDLNIFAGLSRVSMATFDIAPCFAIHIMSVRDVALNRPIRAQDDPKFPCFDMRTAQKGANDWNVILSADRAYVKPVKRCLSRWTNGFRRRRAEHANKIFFS